MNEIFVVNVKDPKRSEFHREYCGRGSIWGNPFVIQDGFSRDKVISLYTEYFYKNIDKFKDDLDRLVEISKIKPVELACFCSPKNCHCDVIKTYLSFIQMDIIADGNIIYD